MMLLFEQYCPKRHIKNTFYLGQLAHLVWLPRHWGHSTCAQCEHCGKHKTWNSSLDLNDYISKCQVHACSPVYYALLQWQQLMYRFENPF